MDGVPGRKSPAVTVHAGVSVGLATLLLILLGTSAAATRFAVEDIVIGRGSEQVHGIRLHNTATGELLTAITDVGGRVEELVLREPKTQQLRAVLLDHGGNASAIRANAHWQNQLLIPYANRIKDGRYRWNGSDYQLPVNEDKPPWRHNAIHGLLWNQTLAVAARAADDRMASVTLAFTFRDVVPGYPFALALRVTYTLSDAGLAVQINATNLDPHWPLPFYNGMHPYFRLHNVPVSQAYLVFDPCTSWVHMDVEDGNSNLNSTMIPTGRVSAVHAYNGSAPIGGSPTAPTYIDDEFKALRSCAGQRGFRTTLRDGDTDIVLWQDENYRFLQVFSGSMSLWGAPAVAIEPMSAACNAFNSGNGLHTIDGGETFSSTYGIQLE